MEQIQDTTTDAGAARLDTKPTRETYDAFLAAYDFFNRALFGGELPNCLITLQRRKRSYGYFSGDRFASIDGQLTDEIAMNPAHFRNRPVHEVLATLAHEMVHLWQHHHGTPGRGRYHNREWAAKMKAVGLQPTDTGEEGGKEIGERVHHLIVPGGPFDRAVTKLAARNFSITWAEHLRVGGAASGTDGEAEGEPAVQKAGRWFKFQCPACDQSARAKYDASLKCGVHDAVMDRQDASS